MAFRNLLTDRPIAGMMAGVIAAFFLIGPSAAAVTGPRDVIEQFHGALLDVWRESASLTVDERFARLAGPVEATFDARAMLRVAAGSAWRDASPGEQDRLVDAFNRYSTSTYADRFVNHSGQSFLTGGERTGPDNQAIVETAIVRATGSTIALDYVLHPVDDGWKVIDVIANGVSELAVLRADYRQTLRAGGVPALVDALTDLADKRLGR